MGITNSSVRAAPNGFQAGATVATATVTSAAAQAFFATVGTGSVFVFNQDSTNGLWVGIATTTVTTNAISDYKKIGKVNAGESVKFEFDNSFAFCIFGKTTNNVSTTFFYSEATKYAAT